MKIVASRGQKMSKFRVISRLSNVASENSIISETVVVKAKLRTAFERELNSHRNVDVRFDLVNGLTSRGHQIKKAVFERNNFVTANNSSIRNVQQ